MPVATPPLVPGAGPRPFRTRDDVLAQIDDLLEGSPDVLAPIRDALVDALTALLLELEYRSEYALAECDLLRATVQYLTAIGGDDRAIPRAIDEQDENYRGRLLGTPDTVTETAIILGVNLILAPFTTVQCQMFDGILDRWFIGTGASDPTWRSFIGATPEYPDRLYSGQETINGAARPNSDPGGARIFSQTLGRQFVLRLPQLSSLTQPTGMLENEDVARKRSHTFVAQNTDGFFIGQSHTVAGGTAPLTAAAIVNPSFAEPLSIYRAIESFVNSAVGQSVRWGFFAELKAA